MKKKFYCESAYLLGIALIAFGTALMTKADFGLSMVVAPAYLVHLKLSETLPFFTFGMAEYTLQAILIVIMSIILRRFKLSYLFSFVTAVLYGFMLDGSLLALSFVSQPSVALRLALFVGSFLIITLGVAFVFHTYIPPEAYEMVVKELSRGFGWELSRVKITYDLISLAVSVALSFAFFGLFQFRGISFGTAVCAVANGPVIGLWDKLLTRSFDFVDAFPLRKRFEA